MQIRNKRFWYRRHPFASLALATAILAAGLLSTGARVATGQVVLVDLDLGPLSSVSVPTPTNAPPMDQEAAVRLGKALFWDTQVGGDGQTACATCHFRGGADNRTFNTLNPGPDKIFASGGVTAAGQQFHPSNVTNDDRVASQGLPQLTFLGVDPDPAHAADLCNPGVSPIFGVERQVTTRNAPTTASGLVFFRQMFLDGRGNDNFNGVS